MKRRRRLVAALTLAALLVATAQLATRTDHPTAGIVRRDAAARTLSPATAAVPVLPIARTPGSHLAPSEPVPILMYHVIGQTKPDTPNKSLWVSPGAFRSQVRSLKRAGYGAVTLRQVWKAWHGGGKLPRKPIVLSFDDGYAGQVRYAMPTLERAGWAGVLNLTLQNLPDLGGSRAVKRMIAVGWEVDSHTLTHPDLTTLSPQALRSEVAGSRRRLRRLFKIPASFFCYPNGRYDDAVVAAVRQAGYKAATTVQSGWADPAEPFTLARVRVDGGMTAKAVLARIRALRR